MLLPPNRLDHWRVDGTGPVQDTAPPILPNFWDFRYSGFSDMRAQRMDPNPKPSQQRPLRVCRMVVEAGEHFQHRRVDSTLTERRSGRREEESEFWGSWPRDHRQAPPPTNTAWSAGVALQNWVKYEGRGGKRAGGEGGASVLRDGDWSESNYHIPSWNTSH